MFIVKYGMVCGICTTHYTFTLIIWYNNVTEGYCMKTLDQISLKENERQAIVELKNAILAQYPEAEIILFGSKARGDSSDESDMDLLILIDGDVDDFMRENIFDIAYIIELKYDVVFGIIVEAKVLWYSDKTKYIPLYNSIRKDGVITQ